MGDIALGAKGPCNKCTDRWFDGKRTCHSTCTRYAAFCERNAKRIEDVKRENDASYAVTDILKRGVYRAIKIKRPEK